MKQCFIKKKEISIIFEVYDREAGTYSYIAIQYFSTWNEFAPLQGTFGIAWRHFCCYSSWGWWYWYLACSVSSVTQSCLKFNDLMDCSMPGFPVQYQHPEFTQTHVHRVGDAIQPSHPLPAPSSHLHSVPASRSFPMSQVFASNGQSIWVSASASVLPMNIQDWFPLGWTG